MLENGSTNQAGNTMITKMFELSGRCKVGYVLEYINEMVETGAKFLLFCHHQFMMDAVCEQLRKNNCGHIRIDGKTTMEDRPTLVNLAPKWALRILEEFDRNFTRIS
jgi:SWI/SNF-related matrix-associated actin-dependent regulator of chromatin subfamily A-like protein 1